MVQIQARR